MLEEIYKYDILTLLARRHFLRNTKSMNVKVKHAVTSTIFLKAVSLVIGFLFWSILSESFTAYKWVTIPVAFYNKGNELIESTEKISIELRGKSEKKRKGDKAFSELSTNSDISAIRSPQVFDKGEVKRIDQPERNEDKAGIQICPEKARVYF